MILCVYIDVFTIVYILIWTASTIPHAVVIIADYQYKAAFVSDQEINLLGLHDRIDGSGEV